MSHAQKTCTRN